ncbi:hypothetical protein HS088_TW15G00487 [Tripterygium wilfordii]|uniref:Uncharacterized protein n=1 Tax=Tripterygium wilfordii TaxID=458696 RepID=A0A7J7CLR3_TRIWF|nr:uncharacterized protein LOC120017080 [Tripterygium wilfordii]XP_038726071.1 uncharacterized protein LOC120017080 [Tripterygium wilfordii]KAF5734988.1 hypothetical protein HS088_TW15G00487 [Tripterygium wilfordii]
MAITLLSVPNPHQAPLFGNKLLLGHGSTTLVRYPSKSVIPLSASSPSPSTSVVEDGPSPSSDSLPVQPGSATEEPGQLPLRGCKACGREEIEKGCNGDGRIQGGIATVPGFGWWPIKAYRPCPGLVASGGRYRRRGQSMDEVGFGRAET